MGVTLRKLASLEKEFGPAFRGVVGDAADDTVLEKLFISAEEHFGKTFDIVVVNAGRGLDGSVMTADLSQFEDLIRINVTGALSLLQMAAKKMVDTLQDAFPESAADIVIIGSVVGRNVSPFSTVYGASKFAVHALAEGLRREVSPKGIRVSLVEPGLLMSGFQAGAGYSDELVQSLEEKFGPALVGDDVANAILLHCHSAAPCAHKRHNCSAHTPGLSVTGRLSNAVSQSCY